MAPWLFASSVRAADAGPPLVSAGFSVRSWPCDAGIWPDPENCYIRKLTRTPDGYLWIDSPRGLIRFDGQRFATLTPETVPALGDPRVRSLAVDGKGDLWVGTAAGTLSRRRAGRFEAVPLDPRLRDVPIESLNVTEGGEVWLATERWGMVRVRDGKCDFSASRELRFGVARDVVPLDNDEWAASGYYDLQRFDGKTWAGEDLGLEPKTNFWTVAPDREGTGLWVATGAAPGIQRGTRVFHVREGRIVRELAPYPWAADAPGVWVNRMIEDCRGRIWVGFYRRGLFYWDPEQGWHEVTSSDGSSLIHVTGLHADADGLVWAMTRDRKLHRIQPLKVATLRLPPEFRTEFVTGVCIRRNGTLWVGTNNAGVFRFEDGHFTRTAEELPSPQVTALFEDSRENLWVGTAKGMVRWKGGSFERVRPPIRPGIVRAILEDRQDNVWWIENIEVVKHHPDGRMRVFDHASGLGVRWVKGLAESADGSIFVTVGGRTLCRLDGDRFVEVGDLGERFDFGLDLHADEDGSLWIAPEQGGLFRFHGGKLREWSAARGDGLPVDGLREIIQDRRGRLWIASTNGGIFGCRERALLDYRRGETPPVLFWQLDEEDGLVGGWIFGRGQPSAAKSADGRLWFPNQNGVVVFDPEVVTREKRDFPPVIEEVTADGAMVRRKSDGSMELLSGIRHLLIHFTCADLESPDHVRFRYRMDGWDDDWIEVENDRVAHYTGLAPGNYRFRLMVGHESGEWVEYEAPLPLSVVPRWWERRPVRASAGIIALAAMAFTAWGIGRFRMRRRLACLEQQHLLQQEREQGRLALEESEERYRTLFARSRNPIIVTDVHTLKFKYANPAAAAMLGYTEAELCALGVEDIYPPEVLDAVYRRFDKLREGMEVEVRGFPAVRKDGSELHVELSSSTFTSSEGRFSITFFDDVTERRNAIEALRRSEHLARLLLNATTDVTHLVDEDGTILDLNDEMAARLGATREELIGTCVYDRFPRQAAGQRRNRIRQAIATGEPLRFIDRVRPGVTWDVGVYPIATPPGEKGQAVVFAHDVTERERGLRALKESEQRFRATFEQAAVGIAHLAPGGVFLRINKKFCDIVKYSEAELMERRFQDITHPDDLDLDVRQSNRMLRGEIETYALEKRYIQKGGDLVWVSLTVSAIRDQSGQIEWFVAVAEDITSVKEAQTELQLLRLELAHVSRVSTLGQLSTSLAHELNQPLGAILSNAEAAEMLLEAEDPGLDEVREILADIRRDDERASEVIRRMRVLLRKQEMQMQRLDVNELVKGVVDLVRADASMRGAAIHLELSPDLPPVRGDRIHLQQVLLNLIINGLEASDELPVSDRRLMVRTNRNRDGHVEVAVVDRGAGIAPDQLPRMFEPFFTTKSQGMGMGTAIAQTIIQAHGGRIRAENNPGGGATFRFSLPPAEDHGGMSKLEGMAIRGE